MQDVWGIFSAVVIAHALGVASPGPDFAIVVRQSLQHGRRNGVLTALGIGCGILIHLTWGMLGLGWAIQKLPALLDILRFGGAALLMWIGYRSLQLGAASESRTAAGPSQPESDRRAFIIGLATNVLNVKAVLFFVALCASVISAGASTQLKLALGAWLSLATFAWFSLIAFSVGHAWLRVRLARRALLIDRTMGLVLIAMAIALVAGGPLLGESG
tara:strand:- start:11960 stop:12607 length:648 start_codon:yes stop_codon:yes gene_type:complete